MALATWSNSLLHEDQAKLTSIVAWGDNVAVGTAEGLLLHLAPPANTPPLTEPVLQSRTRASTEQHAVVALCAAEACGVLVLLLGDGTLTTHELPSLKSCGPVERGVDCTQMTLLRASSVEGCRLAAAGRKKLLLYRWRQGGQDAGGFEPLSEVSLPEPMRWMAWCGDEKLWVAMKQRYATLHLATRQMADVLPFGGAAGGGKEAKKGGSDAGGAASGLTPGPMGVALGGSGDSGGGSCSTNEALLLAQETLGVFVDAHGKPSRAFSMTFAEPPLALASSSAAFLVSLNRKGADVHALHGASKPPLQRLPQLAGSLALASAGTAATPPALRPSPVYVLSVHSVERLLPPTLPAHTLSLASSGDLESAISLSESAVLAPLKAAGEHDAALAHLGRLAQLMAPAASPSTAAAPAAEAAPATTAATTAASAQPQPQPQLQQQADRRSGKQHMRSESTPSAEAPTIGPPAAEPADGDGSLGLGSVSRLGSLAVTYLRSLDASSTDEGPILRRHADLLLRREPQCASPLLCDRRPSDGGWLLEPAAARSLLTSATTEALAVHILEKMLNDAKELERPDAVKAIVDVLLPIAANVASGPSAGGASTAEGGVAPSAAQEKLYHVLRAAHSEAALDNGRTLLAVEKAAAAAAAAAGKSATPVRSPDAGGTCAVCGAAASKRCSSCKRVSYCSEACQRNGWKTHKTECSPEPAPPPPPLTRHRLLLLGFLGRHREALDLLASDAADIDLACEYCREHSGPLTTTPDQPPAPSSSSSASTTASTSPPSLFLQLLERYLTPPSPSEPRMTARASDLLRKWPANVSAVEALRRLPQDLPLSDIEGGLMALLRATKQRQRQWHIRSALIRANSLTARADLHERRAKRVVVDAETECFVCGRRIGNAAFTWLANGTFAHIGCHAASPTPPEASAKKYPYPLPGPLPSIE